MGEPHERLNGSPPSTAAPAGDTSEPPSTRPPYAAARRFGLLAVGCLLVATMLAGAIAHRISGALREPDLLVAALTSPEIMNSAYEELLPAALADQLGDAVLETESGEEVRLPEHAPRVGRDFVETIWPRDVVRAQIDTAVGTWAPQLARGEPTSEVAFGPTRAGWSALSTAVTTGFDALQIYSPVIDRLVAPPVRTRTNEALGPVFAVSLSVQESRAATRRLLPEAWVATQIAALADAAAPYLAGAATQFEAVIPLRSRVPTALQILHEEITDEPALRLVVREQVLSPLIEARIRQAGRLPLGIELSSQEVETALLTSIPPGWFAGEASRFEQVLADYLVGDRDDITLEIPLAERNTAFARRLADLVHVKIGLQLAELPRCERRQLFAAGRSLRAARLPACAPGSVSLLTGLVTPIIEAQFQRIVDAMPTALLLEHGAVARHLGDESMASLDGLRQRIHDGLVWTDRDLVRLAQEHDAGPALALVRRGTVSPEDLEALIPPGNEGVRQAVAAGRIAVKRPWLLDLVSLALLGAIAGIAQGNRWRRLRVCAYALSISAAVVVVTLVFVDLPSTSLLVDLLAFDPQSWPRLSDALALGPVPSAVADLARDLRNTAAMGVAPWIALGPIVHVGRRISSSRRAARRNRLLNE